MTIKQLTDVLPPPSVPQEVPEFPDWPMIERKLGVQLPDDYKDFCTTYGTGTIGEFIHVYTPFANSEYLSLAANVEAVCEIQRSLKVSEGDTQVPFDVYPNPNGILPWGGDDNGNWIYWVTEGKPNDWPCVVGEGRGSRWERFDMPMTAFLAKVLSGKIKCGIWPPRFAASGRRRKFAQHGP